MQKRSLIDGLAVAPQIDVADIATLAREGVRGIINNRPDGEGPGQPTSAELGAAAAAAGLAYRHIPVTGATPGDAAVLAFGQALAEMRRPVLAFCRSGTRSTTLWALASARAGQPVDEILARALAAGYDLAGLRPRLVAAAAR